MNLTFRLGEEEDQTFLTQWLLQPGVLDWFPLNDIKEVEDAVRIWMSYRHRGSVITALVDGIPCGIATLYLSPYKKLAHQSLFAIILDEKHRGKGIGTALLEYLLVLAKETFLLELVHLEVYEGNPAIGLYRKLGFEEFGVERGFIKSQGKYFNKIFMQKSLI
jgi:putative acetyltransferase